MWTHTHTWIIDIYSAFGWIRHALHAEYIISSLANSKGSERMMCPELSIKTVTLTFMFLKKRGLYMGVFVWECWMWESEASSCLILYCSNTNRLNRTGRKLTFELLSEKPRMTHSSVEVRSMNYKMKSEGVTFPVLDVVLNGSKIKKSRKTSLCW